MDIGNNNLITVRIMNKSIHTFIHYRYFFNECVIILRIKNMTITNLL